MRKRSNRLARKSGQYRKFLLLTILFGALSLVGAISYNSASATNKQYALAEEEKLKLLEDRFNAAKSKEELEFQQDIQAVKDAETKAKAEADAAEAAKRAVEEEAARVAARKALEQAAKIVTSTKVTQPTPVPIVNPATGSTMTLLGTLSSTAYTHTGNNMANGEYPYEGAVACNLVPLGTNLYIEGYGYFVVKDRIGHSSQLDIFMDTYQECIQYGRRSIKVFVVK